MVAFTEPVSDYMKEDITLFASLAADTKFDVKVKPKDMCLRLSTSMMKKTWCKKDFEAIRVQGFTMQSSVDVTDYRMSSISESVDYI